MTRSIARGSEGGERNGRLGQQEKDQAHVKPDGEEPLEHVHLADGAEAVEEAALEETAGELDDEEEELQVGEGGGGEVTSGIAVKERGDEPTPEQAEREGPQERPGIDRAPEEGSGDEGCQ